MLREEAAFAIPRAQSRPVGSQLQARPGRRLEPRQQSDRRAAPREAREFDKKIAEKEKGSPPGGPRIDPPLKEFPYAGPELGPENGPPFFKARGPRYDSK